MILLCYPNVFFRLQEARLEVLKRILEQREEDHAELNAKRLDRLWLENRLILRGLLREAVGSLFVGSLLKFLLWLSVLFEAILQLNGDLSDALCLLPAELHINTFSRGDRVPSSNYDTKYISDNVWEKQTSETYSYH